MSILNAHTYVETLLHMKARGKCVDRLGRNSNIIVLTDDEDEVKEIEENKEMGTQHTTGRELSDSKCKEDRSNSDDDVCVVGFKNHPQGLVFGPPRLFDQRGHHIDKLKRLQRPGTNKIVNVGTVRRNISTTHSLRNMSVPSVMKKNFFQMDEVVRLDEKKKYVELIKKIIGIGMVATAQILRNHLLNFAPQCLQTFQPFQPVPAVHNVQKTPTPQASLASSSTPSSYRSNARQKPPEVEYVDLTLDLDDNEVVEIPPESESSADDDMGARSSRCVDNVIDLEQEPEASCSLPQTSSQQGHEEIQYISSTSSESEELTNVEEIHDIYVNPEDDGLQCKSDIPCSTQNKLKGNLSEQMLQQMIINDDHIGRKKDKSNEEPKSDEDDYEESLPEITDEMQVLVHRAFHCNSNKVLVQAFNMMIRPRDIHTLKGNNWLNDEVINFYMCLLMERGKLCSYPSVYCFNTFFYVKLLSSGHASLKRWTRKIDLFSYDLVIVPVHLKVHWCLACINFIEKRIEYYDSMYGKNDECGETLFQYLKDEYLDKKNKTFKTSGWEVVNVEDIPEQLNGCDCGVFVCTYAEYICRLAKLTFTQREMPCFRVKMAYEILTKKLML